MLYREMSQIFGRAHKHISSSRMECTGTYYKTHPNGGIYDPSGTDETYTWYMDGATCWLKGVRNYSENWEDEEDNVGIDVTFDFNYDQYIKLSTPEPEEVRHEVIRTTVTRLHHRVAELQKQLAEAPLLSQLAQT